MLSKSKKTLVSLCLCSLISACSSQGGTKPSQGHTIKKGQTTHAEASTSKPFYKNEVFQILMGIAALYGLSKVENGLDMATLASNHTLKNKELKRARTAPTAPQE